MEIVNVPSLLEEHPESSFLEFASLNGNQFGACDITGKNPELEGSRGAGENDLLRSS